MVATVIANSPGVKKEEFDSLIRPDEAMAKAAGGLGARLTALYETEVARRALRPGEGRVELDISQPGLTYIGLSSSGMPAISRLISASVLRRMSVFAADRITGKINSKRPRFLIIDEANFVNRTLLLELLSRARSAWIPVIVCTQGPTDWTVTQPGEAGLTSLVQNTNVNIIMNQGELTNAELCADIIGRSETMKMSLTMRDGELLDGMGSARSAVEHLVSPDDLRRLSIGEAVIRVGKPSERVTWVRIPQRDPRISPGRP
jgi:type IV secretory pathway TraG/TraD family ATPase VirD4